MSVPSKIFIVGPRGSGKSAFARMLSNELRQKSPGPHTFPNFPAQWQVAEMSTPLINALGQICVARDALKGGGFEDVTHVSEHKQFYRAELVALGDWLAAIAPGALLTHCAKEAQIIVGARRRSEVLDYYTAQNGCLGTKPPWTGHAWIYIERPGVGLEWDRFEREFFQTQICRHHVTNNGDLELLAQNAAALAREFCS